MSIITDILMALGMLTFGVYSAFKVNDGLYRYHWTLPDIKIRIINFYNEHIRPLHKWWVNYQLNLLYQRQLRMSRAEYLKHRSKLKLTPLGRMVEERRI